MTRLRFAVVPTRDRPEDFADCVLAIQPQVDSLIVVAHGDAAWTYSWPLLRGTDWQRTYDGDPPNISRMWNIGLDTAHSQADGEPYDVAVLNDDVIVPPDWFERVSTEMQLTPNLRASAGCVHRPADHRMTGYAFILNGDDGLRADEQFQWWWGDSDLEMQARRLRGVVFAGGEDVEHRRPNSTTVGRLAEIAAEDGIRFAEKWRT